jgi:N utilization substance protein A
MAKSDFTLAFNEITEAHHLPRDVVIDALKQALVSAYRRDADIGSAQRVEAEVDLLTQTTQYRVLLEKEVVGNNEVISPRTEIALDEARRIDPNAKVGDMVMVPQETNTKSFGRIAAQTAKQVILQKIREAERRTLYNEYKARQDDLVTGQVQSVSSQSITLTLSGRAEAVMPVSQMIRGERYKQHDKIRCVVIEVKESTRGPQIIVSRAHKNMLRRLLEYEVPEIFNGQVEIKSIAREPGQRSKVAVSAVQPGIDPVGACVGMRGVRIQSIVKELNEEKIDVIEWNPDARIFIAKALSPAIVTGVYLENDPDQGNTATVVVPDDYLSLAIGREGQNARLAAKLTGWRIDIKSVSESAMNAMARIQDGTLAKLGAEQPDLITEVNRIMEKKAANRTVMPEEYQTLSRFVQMAEQRLVEMREAGHARRHKAMDRVKARVPKKAYTMPIEELELAKDINQVLRARNITNVGDLMLRLYAEEDLLQAALDAANLPADTMDAIAAAVISLVPMEDVKATRPETPAPKAEPTPPVVANVVPDAAAVAEPAPSGVAERAPIDEEEEAPPAFVDDVPPVAPRQRPSRPALRPTPAPAPEPAQPVAEAEPFEDFDELPEDKDKASKGGKPQRGGKSQRGGKMNQFRELIFDEDRGEVVIKRKRKGGRGGRDWEAFDE